MEEEGQRVRRCLVCGEILAGRSDKKFCCDICRHDYHNRRFRKDRRNVEKTNLALLRNCRILKECLEKGFCKISVRRLSLKSFNFEIYTSSRRRLFRPTLYFCYNYVYSISADGFVHIKEINL